MLKQELFHKYRDKLEIAKADVVDLNNQGKTVFLIKARLRVILLTEFLNDLLDLTIPDPDL